MATQFNFTKRIFKEMKNLSTHTTLVSIDSVIQFDTDGRVWWVMINGPAGGPYEGGKFKVEIKFGNSYPSKPPKLRVMTPIFHCNVMPQWVSYSVDGGTNDYVPGSVCVVSFFFIYCRLDNPSSHPKLFDQSTLDQDDEWSVTSKVSTLFDHIAALLAAPEYTSPLNFFAADLYKERKAEYYKHAKHFTKLYAKPNSDQYRKQFISDMLTHMIERGVPKTKISMQKLLGILKDDQVQYNFDQFNMYLDEKILMPDIDTQQGMGSGGNTMSNQESGGGTNNGSNVSNNENEGGANNDSDDDVVYLGTVRRDDDSNPQA